MIFCCCGYFVNLAIFVLLASFNDQVKEEDCKEGSASFLLELLLLFHFKGVYYFCGFCYRSFALQ
jgi:hypothetical protein